MLVASSMGATAFQRGLGAMHALAHVLGARYDAHHGLLNAVLMPYVLEANRSAVEDKIARLANYIGLSPSFDAFLEWVCHLRNELHIPNTLGQLGIDLAHAEAIAQNAVKDPSAGGNPILFDAAQYQSLFERVVDGQLAR